MNIIKTIFHDFRDSSAADWPNISVAERVAWVVFCFACVQLAFLAPYFVLIPQEESKLFSGVVCTAALLLAWVAQIWRPTALKRSEMVISAVLAVLAVMSALFSATPETASPRTFVVLASSLGGFWCARILVVSETTRRFFRSYCSIILALVLILCGVSYVLRGSIYELLDTNPHPLADRILLLWFAPLAVLLDKRVTTRFVPWLLMILSYLVFYLMALRSLLLAPAALAVVVLFSRVLRLKYVLLISAAIGLSVAYYFATAPTDKQFRAGTIPIFYRAENYFFSLHIVLKHPLLGIGLTSPRDEFLKDYVIKYPYITKGQFAAEVKHVGVSENLFLTFLAELGIPFSLMYTFSLGIILFRLIRMTIQRGPSQALHPLALLLPLVGGLIHYMVWDGPLHPQSSWFFHLLLGLAAGSWDKSRATKPSNESLDRTNDLAYGT
ncbi:MAG: O-antigen ligase family protein [Thermodesulfobacteriota bacterium]